MERASLQAPTAIAVGRHGRVCAKREPRNSGSQQCVPDLPIPIGAAVPGYVPEYFRIARAAIFRAIVAAPHAIIAASPIGALEIDRPVIAHETLPIFDH